MNLRRILSHLTDGRPQRDQSGAMEAAAAWLEANPQPPSIKLTRQLCDQFHLSPPAAFIVGALARQKATAGR